MKVRGNKKNVAAGGLVVAAVDGLYDGGGGSHGAGVLDVYASEAVGAADGG